MNVERQKLYTGKYLRKKKNEYHTQKRIGTESMND